MLTRKRKADKINYQHDLVKTLLIEAGHSARMEEDRTDIKVAIKDFGGRDHKVDQWIDEWIMLFRTCSDWGSKVTEK